MVAAAVGAPAGEEAFALFPAGGGQGAPTPQGVAERSVASKAGLEEGVEAWLAGVEQGLQTLGPHHLQPCGLSSERVPGGADDILQGDDDKVAKGRGMRWARPDGFPAGPGRQAAARRPPGMLGFPGD